MKELKKFTISAAQVKKVSNVLPIPTICPNCGSTVERVSNSLIYGKEFGPWPFAYRCVSAVCDSYVGLHPRTDIPLGTLADAPTRAARKQAKGQIMPMWEDQGMDRGAVYRWLAEKMGINDVNHCHIGWFSIAQCKQVIQICKTNRGEKA